MPSPETRTPALTRVARSRSARITAATLAVGLAAGTVVAAGGGTADAASPIRAQSVGRFLDGSADGMALQSLVDLKDARAKAAPNSSSRNPLDAKLFGQGDVPIGDGLKLPGGGVFSLGAANQIAVAKTTGYSYGASGAVSNTGGAELTDESGAYPSDATINLSGAALGSAKIPGLPSSIPGLPSGASSPINADLLGGIVGKIGAAQALAQTEAGGKIVTPQSSLADLRLAIGSPALGALITQLQKAFKTGLGGQNSPLAAALSALTSSVPTSSVPTSSVPTSSVPTSSVPTSSVPTGVVPTSSVPTGLPTGSVPTLPVGGGSGGALPSQCSLTSPTAKPVSLDKGGVVIDSANATITIDLKILLKQLLDVDIANLQTSNFDLVKFLVQNLPNILSRGLEQVVTGITNALNKQFTDCSAALTSALGLPSLPDSVSTALSKLQNQLIKGINTVADPLISGSKAGLTTLADGLTGLVDIGLNVQSGPKIQPRNTNYTYSTQLAKTPDQATNVVKGQSLVRAIEIDLLDASGGGTGSGLPSGLPSLPGTNAANVRQVAGARQAAASGDSAVSIAIANAAAGPSTGALSSDRNTDATGARLPTGVPAGAAGHNDGGSPLLPAALVLLGLVAAGGGALALRTRGRLSR